MVKVKKKERVWEQVQPKQKRKRRKKTIIRDSQEEENQENINRLEEVSIKNGLPQINDEVFHSQRKEEDKQEAKLHLDIRESLFSDIEHANDPQSGYRQSQSAQIKQFFSVSPGTSEVSDLLFVYGTPGVGKTYLIKNLLKQMQLWQKSEWINCFTIVSKNLKFNKKHLSKEDISRRIEIIVLDQFDQLQSFLGSNSFTINLRNYLQQLLDHFGLSFQSSLVRFVLISNKSYVDFQQQQTFLSSVSQFTYKRIIEIPFLPYSMNSILQIIHKKIGEIQELHKEVKFDFQLIDIASMKIYGKSQDIRKVLGFIDENYKKLMKSGANLEEKNMKKKIVETQEKREEDEHQENHFISYLEGRQKIFMKNIVLIYDNEELTLDLAYKQGKRLGVDSHNIDLWLKEWQEMGILQKKQIKIKNQHYLFKKYRITFQVSVNEWKRYFY